MLLCNVKLKNLLFQLFNQRFLDLVDVCKELNELLRCSSAFDQQCCLVILRDLRLSVLQELFSTTSLRFLENRLHSSNCNKQGQCRTLEITQKLEKGLCEQNFLFYFMHSCCCVCERSHSFFEFEYFGEFILILFGLNNGVRGERTLPNSPLG